MRAFTSLVVLSFLLIVGCKPPQLMSYAEFSQLESISYPQLLELNSKNKHVLYIGTYHSNDAQDSIFRLIEDRFTGFQPDFVFHEGGDNWPIYSDRDSTILVSGEPGFVIQMAQLKKVPYSTIEPNEADEYRYLLDHHDLNWVVLMYVCRQIDQQQRFATAYNTTDEVFIRNMDHFIAMLHENGIPMDENQLNYAYWKGQYASLMEKELNWRTFDPIEYYPNYDQTEMNEVNRTSDHFRNKSMVETILQKLDQFDRVFVVVGGGHLTIQKEFLTYQFNEKYK